MIRDWISLFVKNLTVLYKSHSISRSIITYLITYSIIPFLFLCIFFFAFIQKNIVKDFTDLVGNDIDRCVVSVNRYEQQYIEKSIFISSNKLVLRGIKDYANGDMTGIVDLISNLNDIVNDLSYYGSNNEFEIFLDADIGIRGNFINTYSNFKNKELLKKISEAKLEAVVWDQGASIATGESRNITFYRNITATVNFPAFIQVNIPYRLIEEYTNSINIPVEGGFVEHVDMDGTLLYFRNSESTNMQNVKKTDTNKFLLIENHYGLSDGSKIIVGIPKAYVNQKYIEVFLIILAVFILIFGISIVVSTLTSQKITNGLTGFINHIKDNEDILLKKDLFDYITQGDEVHVIKYKFMSILHKMNKIHKDLIDTQVQNNLLQVQVLQSRINPHLLYNSLGVIKMSALMQKDRKSAEAVDSLIKYYRFALNNGQDTIIVYNEINLIREYVQIMNYTYTQDYQLDIQVSTDIYNMYIPNHLLQPVVENALMHGLNGKKDKGIITIRGYASQDKIIFEVNDNGHGMKQETIDSILNMDYQPRRGGYGIKNIIHRIQLCYGGECGIFITSEIGQGTTVSIKIENKITIT